MERKLERRAFLKAGSALLAGAALAGGMRRAAAQPKQTKKAVKYQDKPKGSQKCADCKFFVPGSSPKASGTCQQVEGEISPRGYCILWAKKT